MKTQFLSSFLFMTFFYAHSQVEYLTLLENSIIELEKLTNQSNQASEIQNLSTVWKYSDFAELYNESNQTDIPRWITSREDYEKTISILYPNKPQNISRQEELLTNKIELLNNKRYWKCQRVFFHEKSIEYYNNYVSSLREQIEDFIIQEEKAKDKTIKSIDKTNFFNAFVAGLSGSDYVIYEYPSEDILRWNGVDFSYPKLGVITCPTEDGEPIKKYVEEPSHDFNKVYNGITTSQAINYTNRVLRVYFDAINSEKSDLLIAKKKLTEAETAVTQFLEKNPNAQGLQYLSNIIEPQVKKDFHSWYVSTLKEKRLDFEKSSNGLSPSTITKLNDYKENLQWYLKGIKDYDNTSSYHPDMKEKNDSYYYEGPSYSDIFKIDDILDLLKSSENPVANNAIVSLQELWQYLEDSWKSSRLFRHYIYAKDDEEYPAMMKLRDISNTNGLPIHNTHEYFKSNKSINLGYRVTEEIGELLQDYTFDTIVLTGHNGEGLQYINARRVIFRNTNAYSNVYYGSNFEDFNEINGIQILDLSQCECKVKKLKDYLGKYKFRVVE